MTNHRTAGSLQHRLCIFLGIVGLAIGPAVTMAEDPKERSALKVCADGNNMPYSNRDKEGFENKIAELFGEYLGLPVEYTFFPQRMGFIRNTLKAETGIDTYKCDLVMGVPSKFDIASPTHPYYRTTYVLTYVKGRGFDSVKEAEDVPNLPEEKQEQLRFGMFDRGPAQLWLFYNDLMEYGIPYQSQPGDTRVTIGDMMDRLIEDEVNMTIIYGPFAGWWKKKTDEVEIVTIPLRNHPDYPEMQFEFDMSMAVRYGDNEWKKTVNKFIKEKQDEIHAILDEYNIPTLPMD
ncbi:MAG: quinoprotein dehydrogenase-associated putative ABC transporter substrate-binding protein [Gammaproteobacteria bacterium]|nr:quinoprotein dehydrogenase-associated putative ABC transporter substrate-binding protein [Gammaproteobacteria bacterium]